MLPRLDLLLQQVPLSPQVIRGLGLLLTRQLLERGHLRQSIYKGTSLAIGA